MDQLPSTYHRGFPAVLPGGAQRGVCSYGSRDNAARHPESAGLGPC